LTLQVVVSARVDACNQLAIMAASRNGTIVSFLGILRVETTSSAHLWPLSARPPTNVLEYVVP
jgi:hypothetical protein